MPSSQSTRYWRATFTRTGTSMADHMLILAADEAEAREAALKAWNTPYVSPVDGHEYPVDEFEDLLIAETNPPSAQVLAQWEEPT